MLTQFNHQLSNLLRRAVVALALVGASGMASAGTIQVSINTAGFGVASGFIEMQLSASAGVPLATVTATNLVGFDTSGFIDAFGVSAVPGGYRFRNDTSNDLFHAANFGGTVSFDLNFQGEHDPLTQYISHFVVAAFDVNSNPLGNYNPVTLGLLHFSWTPSDSIGSPGTLAVVSAAPNVTLVPEPDGWLLLGAGLGAIGLARRRRAGPISNGLALPQRQALTMASPDSGKSTRTLRTPVSCAISSLRRCSSALTAWLAFHRRSCSR